MKSRPTFIHTIRKHICHNRLTPPVCYLLFLAILWLTTPIRTLAFPPYLTAADTAAELPDDKFTSLSATLSDLHFTGYTQTVFGHTNGYYYYTFHGQDCLFVLLTPHTCQDGAAVIKQLTVRVQVLQHFKDYHTLTDGLAADLNWAGSAIRRQAPDYLLSESRLHRAASGFLLVWYAATGGYALLQVIYVLARRKSRSA